MIFHGFELFSKLNGLIEISLLIFSSLNFDSSLFEHILKLSHFSSVLVEFHVVLGLSKGSNQLTAGLTSSSKHLKI
jgi:hypothetical protein